MTEKNADEPTPVQLPSKAVSAKGNLLEPLKDLLGGLNLLPSNDDLKKAGSLGSVFQGPPDSVALIEAGGTALSKGGRMAWAARYLCFGAGSLNGGIP